MELKVNDLIVIKSKPICWSSNFSNNCPLTCEIIRFPFKCKIQQIDKYSMLAGNYGWDLETLIKNDLIEKILESGKKKKLIL